ncbi:MAG: UDP-N-acetylmuramoyl-L-alanine--D-glutamate ligase [Sphingobacteriia bacterium]|nr:UDP-N-acetylmuramoyl-L-alanine--D-glutamate ligase [Sphingobacteriia bacterium]
MIINSKLHGKKCLVFGLGKSGIAIIQSLKASSAIVYAWDDNVNTMNLPLSIKQLLKHPAEINWDKLDYLVLSPGIPLYYPEPHYTVKLAKISNTPIISDIEILYDANKQSKFVGITGTNGKSTTTALTHHILHTNGIHSQVGGNIGTPALELESFATQGTYVLELSSFQLDLLRNVKFGIGVLLNITKDHLDRHGNMENYINSKCKLFANQTPRDIAIISVDNEITANIFENSQIKSRKIPISTNKILDYGVSCLEESIIFNVHDHKGVTTIPLMAHLPGRHNRENIAAAFAVGLTYNLSPQNIIRSISTFSPLKHRMEYIGNIANVHYYNDSKATNAEASMAALASFNNIFWIAGGVAKDGGIEALKPYFKNIKKAYLIGEASYEFSNTLKNAGVEYVMAETLDNAFLLAKNDSERAKGTSYVVLSPAAASYDQFKNFEDRGETFRKIFLFHKEIISAAM